MQEYVYLFLAGDFGKIGCSVNPETRLRHILKSNHPELPCEPCIAHVIPVTMARRSEAALHRHFQAKRTDGEWFVLTEDDIAWLRQQTDASLIELANSFELGTYAKLQAPPRVGAIKKRVTLNIRLDEDFLDELRTIADMDYRTAANEAEQMLKWAAPHFRAMLEKERAA